MTTAHSPIGQLRGQADKIAAMLKKIERGEVNDAKIEAARATPCIKVGVVMDDKIVSIDMPWATIRASAEPVLSAFVLKQMQEAREH